MFVARMSSRFLAGVVIAASCLFALAQSHAFPPSSALAGASYLPPGWLFARAGGGWLPPAFVSLRAGRAGGGVLRRGAQPPLRAHGHGLVLAAGFSLFRLPPARDLRLADHRRPAADGGGAQRPVLRARAGEGRRRAEPVERRRVPALRERARSGRRGARGRALRAALLPHGPGGRAGHRLPPRP